MVAYLCRVSVLHIAEYPWEVKLDSVGKRSTEGKVFFKSDILQKKHA